MTNLHKNLDFINICLIFARDKAYIVFIRHEILYIIKLYYQISQNPYEKNPILVGCHSVVYGKLQQAGGTEA